MSDTLLGAFELDPAVVLRDEDFGALAYHFGTRRLTFLKTRELTEVVRLIGTAANLQSALELAGVHPEKWEAYASAVRALQEAGMLRVRRAAA